MNRLPAYSYGSEGYMTKYGHVYSFVKDYQGNVRQVVNERGGVVQESDYYPYGMLFGESDVSGSRSEANRYRYGGKEYLAAAGLNLYDFTARYLDPAVGTTLSSDPNQKDYTAYSPNVFALSNPIVFSDPSGKDAEVTIDGTDITITAKIFLYGGLASSRLAKIFQNDILNTWGWINTYEYGGITYSIIWDIEVSVIDSSQEFVFDGVSNYLEVVDSEERSSIFKSSFNNGYIRGKDMDLLLNNFITVHNSLYRNNTFYPKLFAPTPIKYQLNKAFAGEKGR